MPRKEGMAVPEDNGPIPMTGGITLEDFRRPTLEVWDRGLDKLTKDLRRTYHRLAGVEHGARQLRLAVGVDGSLHKKTRESTEGAAKAVRAMHGDSFAAKKDPRRSAGHDHVWQQKSNLPLSLAGMTSWSRTVLWSLSRVSRSWRCGQQPLVVYFPSAKPLQQQGPPSTTQLFGSTCPKRNIWGLQLYFNSIRLVRQQFLE